MTRKAPHTFHVKTQCKHPRMRAEGDGAARAGKPSHPVYPNLRKVDQGEDMEKCLLNDSGRAGRENIWFQGSPLR